MTTDTATVQAKRVPMRAALDDAKHRADADTRATRRTMEEERSSIKARLQELRGTPGTA
jgi:hypothetical protein